MNWTGGRLQRHSNGNTLTHRQKQHFARLRTQRLIANNAASSPHFQPHYLPPGETESDYSGGAFEARSPPKRQKTLDLQDTLGHLVHRLPSTKPRPSPTHRHCSRQAIHDPSKPAKRPLFPSCEGDTTSSLQGVAPYGKAEDSRQRLAHRDDDGHTCDGKKRRLDSTMKDDLVQRERSKLLARRDWAGLSSSRPLHVRSSSVREWENIEKKHRTGGNKIRRAGGHAASRPPFLDRIQADPGGPWMSGALVNDDEDIVVKIGPDVLATQPFAQGNDSFGAKRRLTPSDPMLFELEDAVQELQPIRAHGILTAGSHHPGKEKEETRHLTTLSDTGMEPKRVKAYAEAEPVEDIERLLQELDECSNRVPASPASTWSALLASDNRSCAKTGNGLQERLRVSEKHEEELMQPPTSLREFESGRKGSSSSPDRAETRVQTRGQPELHSSPPKPFRLLFTSTPNKLSAKEFHYHLARASSGPQSRDPLELTERPSSHKEGFSDARRLVVQGRALDRADQSLDAQWTGSERQAPCSGIGEDGESSTALRNSSADRVARPCFSADRPIRIDAGHGANARSRWVKRGQPTDRSPNSAFSPEREAANISGSSCSDALHSQVSDCLPDIRSPGSSSGASRQITAQAEKGPAEPTQGWIGDADCGGGAEDAETVWKRFVFGEDSRTPIDSVEKSEPLEPAIRSTVTPDSSLLVEMAGSSAAAGTTALSPACAHLHSVGIRLGYARTADASAGRALAGGEKQASKTMASVEHGNTTAMVSPTDNRCLPDAQANQVSDDTNTVAVTAGELPGELNGPDRQERIIFTKPRAFVGSMAVLRPAAGGAAAEGNTALQGTLHAGSAGTASKMWNPRYRRRGQRTTGLSPLIYGVPSRDHTGYAPGPLSILRTTDGTPKK